MDDDPRRHRLDEARLERALAGGALGPWREALARAVHRRGAALLHGRQPLWREALARLPALDIEARVLDAPVVAAEGRFTTPEADARLRDALGALVPWRKGPFRLADVLVDCEWRSDAKWARVAPHLAPLAGRAVLDVGCGSGYHLWRLRGAGAATVLGIEPGLGYVAQFEALSRYLDDGRGGIALLPLTLETLPDAMGVFDTVLSMGVLYHRRDPAAHLVALRRTLVPGGELLLETLVSPQSDDAEIALAGRYARMRNVWTLPSAGRVERWLAESGFESIRLVSVDVTTTAEQRRTAWMPFESLAEALSPSDPELTVEGHPRPRRAAFHARLPPSDGVGA